MEFYCYLSFMSRHTGITTETRKQKQTTANSDKKDRPKKKNTSKNKTKTTKQDNSLYQTKTKTYYDLSHPAMQCNSQLHGLFTGGKLCAWSTSVRGYSNSRIAEGTWLCISKKKLVFPHGFPGKMMTLQKLWSHKLEISTLSNPPFLSKMMTCDSGMDRGLKPINPTAHGRCYRMR